MKIITALLVFAVLTQTKSDLNIENYTEFCSLQKRETGVSLKPVRILATYYLDVHAGSTYTDPKCPEFVVRESKKSIENQSLGDFRKMISDSYPGNVIEGDFIGYIDYTHADYVEFIVHDNLAYGPPKPSK